MPSFFFTALTGQSQLMPLLRGLCTVSCRYALTDPALWIALVRMSLYHHPRAHPSLRLWPFLHGMKAGCHVSRLAAPSLPKPSRFPPEWLQTLTNIPGQMEVSELPLAENTALPSVSRCHGRTHHTASAHLGKRCTGRGANAHNVWIQTRRQVQAEDFRIRWGFGLFSNTSSCVRLESYLPPTHRPPSLGVFR